MKQVVIMPGGFHPFHAGHYALYQQTKNAFPDADVYIAATDDTSSRPFPFALKEKLATLAGVEPGHFVRVKSPFSAEEITSRYDPETTNLIFVKSEKNARGGPSPEGPFPAEIDPATGKLPLVTRGPRKGLPVSDRLQYYRKGMKMAPMSRHAYLAYLPTVEFGGKTSGSEIRAEWPTLDQQNKIALVNMLYPKTKSNPRLAANVAKMLDVAIIGNVVDDAKGAVVESDNPKIDLTPNFPNYAKLIGEFVGARNNKLLFQIVAAELKPGVKPTEKIAKALTNRSPIAMSPNYVKNRQVVPENEDDEYAPPGLNAAQVRHLMTQIRGRQPFVWLKPNQINGSHSEKELLSLGFKKSRFNTWGGTEQMWKRLSGINESSDYVEEKITR